MAVFTKLRAPFRRTATDDVVRTSVEMRSTTAGENQKDTATTTATDEATDDAIASNSNDEAPPAEVPDRDVQYGVQDVEAVTLTWSRTSLIAVFLNIWLLYFVNAMQSSILSNLLPFVTSAFESHSLLNVIYIVADAMSAAMYVPLSKVMDVWGRAQGFAFMTFIATLGLILMAACNNLPTFCAAYVFYSIGFGGMTYCVDVITADASKLKNRGLAYAFTSSPYIITAFAGSKAADDFYYKISWRWGFGCFAIIVPFVAAPLYFVLKYNLKKAEAKGLSAKRNSGRNVFQSIWHYTVEFDALGVILFSVGLTVFLLPFDIADAAPHGWSSGYIIAMIVVGFCMLFVFAIWEWRFAPVPLLNFTFLTNRTVVGACLLDATYQLSYYCWANYYTSFLQVVNDLTIAEAGYVSHTFDVVSGFLLLLVGYLIRRTGRFKWLLYIAVPLYVFTQGLMIYFRRANQSVGYLVMCQVFISIGGSVFILVEQLAILAAVDHQHIASSLALLYVVGTVGDAMGATISGAIWTNTFKKSLSWNLPASAMPDIDLIYEDLSTQLSYPVGSATRLAIQAAYAYAQTRMLAAGVGIMSLAFIWTLMIKNIDLAKVPQVKGMVF
ncbi:Siderophore iron transporter mirB [Cytospora mali]|uniref:Siderophore iron transporter mirB n=1 Tax=Cytospora mali TaxID=578113 RepID=A0A194USZ9_CYTMA|nr:Siderophore iron transporter mirB [Valsa mali var. pyri (nom. inval.)]